MSHFTLLLFDLYSFAPSRLFTLALSSLLRLPMSTGTGRCCLLRPNILTLTGQKLIEWSLKLYMSLLIRFYIFNVFIKIQKTWLFTFFALLHTFSRTMSVTPLRMPLHYSECWHAIYLRYRMITITSLFCSVQCGRLYTKLAVRYWSARCCIALHWSTSACSRIMTGHSNVNRLPVTDIRCGNIKHVVTVTMSDFTLEIRNRNNAWM